MSTATLSALSAPACRGLAIDGICQVKRAVLCRKRVDAPTIEVRPQYAGLT